MRRGNDAHVDRDRLGRSDGPNLVLLQHAQQLHLQTHRHIADLIEQQRAAVGGLEQAFLRSSSTGEGAFFMTKEFGLEKVLRHGTAIDGDERLVAPGTRFVDGACQELLARAALAGQQYPRIGAGHHVGLRQLVFHQLISRNDARSPVFVDVREPGHLEGFLDVIEQILLVDRFGQKPKGAALRGVHRIRNRSMCREDDYPQARPAALQFLEQADAVHLVHAKVRDHQIRPEAYAGG